MRNIYFSYVVQKNFSGQSRATEQIIESLDLNILRPVVLRQYSFDRKKNKYVSIIIWLYETLSITPKLIRLFFEPKPILHLSLGQEWASFIRILWWYIPLVVFKNATVIISLNGRNFQSWGRKVKKSKLFGWILSRAQLVTVVGPKQRSDLIDQFKISLDKIEIIPNTSDFHGISEEELHKKFTDPSHIQVIFLSLLIESKGFKLFLDALLKLVIEKEINKPIKAFLCGTISFTKFCSSFNGSEEKVKKYIYQTITEIKKVARERNIDFEVLWINGIRGIEKETMFKNTHLFVLPTFFPTESQPLALMEAMSTGCGIITTKVGEIEFVIGNSGNFITKPSVDELADEIHILIDNHEKLKAQAASNLQRFVSNYSIYAYRNKWQNIINTYI